MKRIIKCFVAFCLIFFDSCATQSGFSEKADLCGIIVDENNEPVPGYVLRCSSIKNTGVTNENGIFVIPNVVPGKYRISGEKNGYTFTTDIPFDFTTQGDLLCCKVHSMDGAIEAAERQFECKNYDAALELLNGICYETNTQEEAIVMYLKTVVNILLKNEENAKNCLAVIQENRYSKQLKLTEELEDVLNEKL